MAAVGPLGRGKQRERGHSPHPNTHLQLLEKQGVLGLLWLHRVRFRCRPWSGSRARPGWQSWPRVCSLKTERTWDERVAHQGSGRHRRTASSPGYRDSCHSPLGLPASTPAPAHNPSSAWQPEWSLTKCKADIIPLLKARCLPRHLKEKPVSLAQPVGLGYPPNLLSSHPL